MTKASLEMTAMNLSVPFGQLCAVEMLVGTEENAGPIQSQVLE